jgi:hypothetical protein
MSDIVMSKIAELGEQDRALYELAPGRQVPASPPTYIKSS